MGASPYVVEHPPGSPRSLFVTWTLHNRCNFRCSYCPDGLNDGTIVVVTADDVIAFADRVLERARAAGIERWTFAFSGGEPTFFPDFPRVLRELYARGIDATFTSNGGRPLAWWRDVADFFDHCVFSYHPEFTRREEFVEKVKWLATRVTMNVDFMMTLGGFDECRRAGEELHGLPNVAIRYLPIMKEFGQNVGGLIDYTPDQLAFLRDTLPFRGPSTGEPLERMKRRGGLGRGRMRLGLVRDDGERLFETLDSQQVVAREQNRFRGWRCWVGLESLIVDLNGDVYRAYCREGGKLGNVRDAIELPSEPVVCSQEWCTCSVDIEVTKRRDADG